MNTDSGQNHATSGPELMMMMQGSRQTQAIYVAAKLGIADLLKDGPKAIDDLANVVGANPRNLYRVLRALASMGIFSEIEDGRFEMTLLAQNLRADAPQSLRSFAIMLGEDWSWQPAGKLLHSVKTGETAFNHIYGMNLFEYFAQNEDAAEVFDQAMSSSTLLLARAVVDDYDFSEFDKIVDIGGGDGSLMHLILQQNPKMQGVLFDLPSVVGRSDAILRENGTLDRCELIGGNFFEAVPGGGDAYILKTIIHDWEDRPATNILSNCRKEMTEGNRLLLVEHVVPTGNEPHPGKYVDLTMMTMAGGLERTEAEYRVLLEQSGFNLSRIIPTQSPLSVIEAVPV